MSYEDLVSKYRIDDICPEIDNELHGMFIDLIGDEFELGIFPEGDPSNEDNFLVTVEIVCEGVELDQEQAKEVKEAVEQRLAHNLGSDAKTVLKNFSGVQIYMNDELL